MAARRSFKHYPTSEVMGSDLFLTVMDVNEHHWLLEHSHDFPEWSYVLRGKGSQYINGTSVPATENEMVIIPLGATHVYRPAADDTNSAELRVRDVIFRAEWLAGLADEWIDPEIVRCIDWLLGKHLVDRDAWASSSPSGERPAGQPEWIKIRDRCGEFGKLTERLKMLSQQRPPQFKARLTAGVLELLSLFCEATEAATVQHAEWPPRRQPHLHPVKAQLAETIQTMPLDAITAKEVAKRLNVSERHLSRLFAKHFGVTFHSYVQEHRLNESMKLLRESKFSIGEIVQKVGLKDTDHFYSLFKQKTGITPGLYRKQNARRGRP